MAGALGIVVHGMSRSGTSAVAGMFVHAGFFVGGETDMLGATDSNPRGHYENLNLILANERVLGRIGGTWFEPPPASELDRVAESAIPSMRVELDRIVRDASGRPIVLKDPRIDVMITFWSPLLVGEFHPVLVVRHPVEVARSLQRRDGTPLPFGLAAWELHMTRLIAHLDERLVTVIPYAHLMEDPRRAERIVSTVSAHLDRELVARIDPARAPEGVDPQLRHHGVSEADERALLTLRQRELWDALGSLSPGDQTLALPGAAKTPSPSAQEIAHAETKRAWDEAQQAKIIEALEEERARTASLAAERHDARRRAEEAAAAHREAWAMLSAVYESVSWRITRPLRTGKRAASKLRS